MKAEIITIGDEILIGQTVDTNSAWLGESLGSYGVTVSRIVTISDEKAEIVSALEESLARVKLIIITGGLGPTNDDITKATLAEFFNSELETNMIVKSMIEGFYKGIGKEPLEINLKQADLPVKSDVIINRRGTASGMWFDENGSVVVSMPGVPYEMKGLMRDEIFDKIVKRFSLPTVYNRTLLTIGLGESRIAERLIELEREIRNEGLGLAYLPSSGMVRIRISGSSKDEEAIKKKIDDYSKRASELLKDILFGYDNDSLEAIVGELLQRRKETVSVAESCTGGYISHLITSVSGSSNYYDGSVVTYSYDAKESWVGVSRESLLEHGAVSESVVEQMAVGVREKFNTTYGISASGIAGPEGGTENKPVGTVWVGLAGPDWVKSFLFQFGKSRKRNIIMTSNNALNLLRKELVK